MTTPRRYEMGRPVFDNRAEASVTGPAKNVSASRATRSSVSASTPEPEVPKTPAKIMRRPPPVVVAEPMPDVELPDVRAGNLPVTPPPAVIPDATLEDTVRTEPKLPAETAPPRRSEDADEQIADTSDMRKFLLKQMVRAAKGEITTETVKNIVTLSQQVYNATTLELKAAAILKNTDKSIRALELVAPQDNGSA